MVTLQDLDVFFDDFSQKTGCLPEYIYISRDSYDQLPVDARLNRPGKWMAGFRNATIVSQSQVPDGEVIIKATPNVIRTYLVASVLTSMRSYAYPPGVSTNRFQTVYPNLSNGPSYSSGVASEVQALSCTCGTEKAGGGKHSSWCDKV